MEEEEEEQRVCPPVSIATKFKCVTTTCVTNIEERERELSPDSCCSRFPIFYYTLCVSHVSASSVSSSYRSHLCIE